MITYQLSFTIISRKNEAEKIRGNPLQLSGIRAWRLHGRPQLGDGAAAGND